MQNSKTTMLKLAATSNWHLFPIIALSLSSLALTACQKEPETEPVAETPVQTTPEATSFENNIGNDTVDNQVKAADSKSAGDVDLASLENNIGAADVTPNAETTTSSSEQAIAGTQITNMTYRNAAGENLSVIFETSAAGVLNAIVTLPNKPKMTLSAPEGQGNNPTYRSKDGSIELISHGGGSSIDLVQKGKVTSFEATSAEAEVVSQS